MPVHKPQPTTTLGRKQQERERRRQLVEAEEIHSRIYIPELDHEPPYSAELVDRFGTVWLRNHRHAHDGWYPEDMPELELKWSSPAMQAAGPFAAKKKRTPEQVAAHHAKAANGRQCRAAETGKVA